MVAIAMTGSRIAPVPQHDLVQETGLERPVQFQGTQQPAPVKQEDKKPEKEPRAELNQVAAELEHISLAFNKRLQFEVDQKSHDITVKVIDRETDKVIKELPPEELQRLHNKIRETIGLLFDELV